MTHRIAVIGTGFTPAGSKAPPAEIAAVAGAGFAPELIETTLSVFPGTPYERGLCVLGYVETGIRAAEQGYAAAFINTVGDYGIDELRSAVAIPVVGAGEAAMTVATTLGRRFAIVTIWPTKLNFIYDERIRSCRMNERCIGVFNVLANDEMTMRGDDTDPVAGMRSGKQAMIDRIVRVADQAVAAGADTIVLGCTCMAPIGARIAARMAVPVVEAMTAGYKYAEALVGLKLSHSAAAYPRAAADRLTLARDLVAGAGVAAQAEDCEVCVVATAAE
ncbi:MAG: aspartate/glutamate racemase family protein [Rhodospirillaceae bacterium]|nr:aspartate/glutamate racemase family protein [Rhodospirillaceae bacterium]